jgi:formyltetrahydrofolate-dependent phosphoribosylglycinamide formyltransferase
MPELRVAVMASGGGTNLQQLLDKFPDRDDSTAGARVCLVVSNRPGIGALERAERAGVRTEVVDPAEYESPEAFGNKLIELYESESIGLVVLAGYLKMLPSNLIAAYRNRMINIHPALLPLFGGKGMYGSKVHKAVLEAGVKLSGPTVHFVDEEYDRGPIIAQRPVPVYHTDTPETLAARVLEVEHQILPEVVSLIAAGRVNVVSGVVHVTE